MICNVPIFRAYQNAMSPPRARDIQLGSTHPSWPLKILPHTPSRVGILNNLEGLKFGDSCG